MPKLSVGVFALLFGPVLAQSAEPGSYVGVGLANFDYEQDIDSATFSDSATATKVYGGYRFSDRWAFEAAYDVTDTVEESASGSIPGVGPVSATVGADFDLITLRGLWHAPLSWGSFFVGAGYFDGEVNAFVDLTEGTSSLHVEDTASEDGPTAILGLQWDLTRLSLRVEYEWWDIEDADAEQIGAGVHFRF